MQTWLKSFESKFSEALEAFVCVCVKGTKIADMSGWVQKVHIHHPGESRAGSHSGPFRPSGRQNGRLAAAALQMCDWWPTNDKRTEEKKSSERSCFSHATVSYCICKENGLLIDPHTRRLMHMHALRRAHIRAEHTQEWCFCVGSSCDGRDARQQWHFCCHKQFSFHNRKNQI